MNNNWYDKFPWRITVVSGLQVVLECKLQKKKKHEENKNCAIVLWLRGEVLKQEIEHLKYILSWLIKVEFLLKSFGV